MVTELPPIIQLENSSLRVELFPTGGGKLTRIYNKELGYEFLWKNAALTLEAYAPGTEYDPVFYGGVDELLPNDIPENVDGNDYPDHGELWTTPLAATVESTSVTLAGVLPVSGLYYSKTIRLVEESPTIVTDYLIRNDSDATRYFLWKLHAALHVGEGDRIVCDAAKGQVVDPAYSRFSQIAPFAWPVIEQTDVSILPARNGSMDFFYLYDLKNGEVSWESADGRYRFGYTFDTEVFPYVWLFASYGGFLEHHTAILEPCTAMPISVNDAARLGQCSMLEPGEELRTRVTIYAGKKLLV